mmetsp:Transcript_32786/g.53091  ORF Transcript_32786/g.53091 Transcript_32786/m.53091 type:complete len:80 (+) Transcript_32786:347-586(+)
MGVVGRPVCIICGTFSLIRNRKITNMKKFKKKFVKIHHQVTSNIAFVRSMVNARWDAAAINLVKKGGLCSGGPRYCLRE